MMSESVYSFDKQLIKGEDEGEKILDIFYGKRFDIQKVSMELQRLGIDRIWTDKTGYRNFVEYKTDFRASSSGKVFIETISVDTQDKLGWIYTSCAFVLIFYVPGLKKAFITRIPAIRFCLKEWLNEYEKKVIPNETYNTVGICVPIVEFEKICSEIDTIDI